MPNANTPEWIQVWNRKLHIYVGLFFLLFIWLFSFTGLLLNHPQWEFAQYWPSRKEVVSESPIRAPMARKAPDKAKDLMAQLDITGEIERITFHPVEGRFAFRVIRPGRMADIQVDFKAENARVKTIVTDGWGIVHMLHQFNGVRMDAPEERRDWIVTHLWSLSMDALCLGLIFLILSSVYMWYQLEQKRRPGLLALGVGIICCGFFIFGLSRMG